MSIKTLILIFEDNKIFIMRNRDYLILAVVFLGACAMYFCWSLLITEPGYPLDDSWIHQVFARNIATGHGFSFNPDIPISGATAPLWTLLMALLWPISGPLAGGILAGVILEFLAIVAIYKLTLLINGRRDLALIVGLISSMTCVLIWGALSGMEVGLYSALSLWGLYFYFMAKSFDDKRNYLAYTLFALAFLARPECALFLAAAMIRDIIIWFKSNKKPIIPWIWRIFLIMVLVSPYFTFNYSTIGSVFPNTYTAKVLGPGLAIALIHGNIKDMVKILTIEPYFYFQEFIIKLLILNPILLLGLLAGILKLWKVRDQLCSNRRLLLLLVLLALPIMALVSPGQAITHQNMRQLDNIILLIILLGTTGLFWENKIIFRMKPLWMTSAALFLLGIILAPSFLIRFWAVPLSHILPGFETGREYDLYTRNLQNAGAGCIIIAVIFAMATITTIPPVQKWLAGKNGRRIILGAITLYTIIALIYRGNYYANNVKNINEMDKRTGLYLKNISVKNQKIAVNDIGAIGYFSGATILDLKGLVSPEITPQMILNDSLAFEYMLTHDRVDYLAIFPYWFRYIPKRTDIFKPIDQFGVEWNTILGGDTTIVYKANWP